MSGFLVHFKVLLEPFIARIFKVCIPAPSQQTIRMAPRWGGCNPLELEQRKRLENSLCPDAPGRNGGLRLGYDEPLTGRCSNI